MQPHVNADPKNKISQYNDDSLIDMGQTDIESFIKLQNIPLLYETAKCESNFRENAVGDSGLAYGVFQFHERTFNSFRQKAGMPYLEYHNPYDQTILASWAFKNGLSYHWTCFTRLNTVK